jgi:hypoxanthine phosphoribosyltransferase
MKLSLNSIKKEIDRFIEANPSFFNNIEFVIGMSRGGLIPAVLVSTKLNKPLVTAYINKQDEIFFDRAEWIKDKKVLIVDDITRSGRTMFLLKQYLEKNSSPKSIKIYTVYSVVPMRDKSYKINISATEIKKDANLPWDYDR